MDEKKLSVRTSLLYAREIKRFRPQFKSFCGFEAEDASEQQIREYLLECYPAYVKSMPALRLHICAVKDWFYKCRGQRLTFACTLKDERQPAATYLSHPEIEALNRRLAQTGYLLVFQLIRELLLRPSEALRVRVGDWRSDPLCLLLRDEAQQVCREIPIDRTVYLGLERHASGKMAGQLLFPSHNRNSDKAVSVRNLELILSKACHEAGIQGATLGRLREQGILERLRAGQEQGQLATLIGAKSRHPMQRYRKMVRSFVSSLLLSFQWAVPDSTLIDAAISLMKAG